MSEPDTMNGETAVTSPGSTTASLSLIAEMVSVNLSLNTQTVLLVCFSSDDTKFHLWRQ